jgi:hypothetical protein
MKLLPNFILFLLFIPQVYFGQTSSSGLENAWSDLSSTLIRRNDLIQNLNIICKDSKFVNQDSMKSAEFVANQFTKHLKLMSIKDKKAIQLATEYNSNVESNLTLVLISIEEDTILVKSEKLLNVLYQIEGTENRIAVKKNVYNNLCTQSSNSDMKFDDSKQNEIPKVKF